MRGYRADGRRGVVGGMSGPPPKIQISLSYIVKLLKIGLGPHPLTGKHRYPSNIPPWKKISGSTHVVTRNGSVTETETL